MKKGFVKILAVAVLAGILTSAVLTGCNDSSTQTSTTAATSTESSAEAPKKETYDPTPLDPDTVYFADIDIKDYGKIIVKLDQKSAPITCANFVALANTGFYDGLTFHRIMKDFMMQGGDPEGTGNGGSENTIKGEFSANGVENPLLHTRGAISMARASYSMDSASSQFFIVHQTSPHLDGQYACFGYVTDGMSVVDKICEEAEPIDNNGTIEKEKQPVINSIKIRT